MTYPAQVHDYKLGSCAATAFSEFCRVRKLPGPYDRGMLGGVNPAWVEMLHKRASGGRQSRATEVGLSVDEYVARAEVKIRNWVSGAHIRIRIREEQLVQFLLDGEYKTMAETGQSGGGMTRVEARLKAEQQVLGIPIDGASALRPISAYLSGSDETGKIAIYGEIVLTVNDYLRSRTWFLLGDLVDTPILNLGQALAPVPLLMPSIDAASYRWNVIDAQTLPDVCGPHRYAEALIFGGLAPCDLLSVCYPPGIEPTDEVVRLSADEPWKLTTCGYPTSEAEAAPPG